MREDQEIIELFWQRSETALELTEQKYNRYCHSIATRILGDGDAAREICNDTLLKAWDSIPPMRPASLKIYLARICRQLSINRLEKRTAKKRDGKITAILDELSECIPDASRDSIVDSIALKDALNGFLASTPKRERDIFIRRYWYALSLGEIAKEYKITENSVGVILYRQRERLRSYLEREGISL